MKKREFFKVEGDKINRIRRHCPKCGPGVFIAEHKDRFSCGKCGYTEFKSGGKKEKPAVEKPKEEKSVESEKTVESDKNQEKSLDEPKPEETEKVEEKEDKKD